MTLDVYRGRKTTMQQQQVLSLIHASYYIFLLLLKKMGANKFILHPKAAVTFDRYLLLLKRPELPERPLKTRKDIHIVNGPISVTDLFRSSTMQNVIGPICISHLYRTFLFFYF